MKKLLATFSVALAVITAGVLASKHGQPVPNQIFENGVSPIDRMPIVDTPYSIYATQLAPVEQRGEEFRRWLAPSLKIQVQGGSGSGTIVYYDPKEQVAYVQSCGHLWNGNMSAQEGRGRNVKCSVVAWYHNEKKLDQPRSYEADVLYYSNTRGQDCSLLKFKPDWVPDYFPIAPAGYAILEGTRLHSVGCDGGREVAHYDVKVVGERPAQAIFRTPNTIVSDKGIDLITTENSPRPGRSGGGLLTDEFYVGICWGTSDKTGNGIGLFTPLNVVRQMNASQGFDWLNEVGSNPARQIPILDRNNPQGKYPLDYIPLPLK